MTNDEKKENALQIFLGMASLLPDGVFERQFIEFVCAHIEHGNLNNYPVHEIIEMMEVGSTRIERIEMYRTFARFLKLMGI